MALVGLRTILGHGIIVLNKMPLYQVRRMDRQIIRVFEAMTPAKAAIKAFNCHRRQNDYSESEIFHCMVYTEGKRSMTEYEVQLQPIENPTEHEKKYNIHNRTIAKKVSRGSL